MDNIMSWCTAATVPLRGPGSLKRTVAGMQQLHPPVLVRGVMKMRCIVLSKMPLSNNFNCGGNHANCQKLIPYWPCLQNSANPLQHQRQEERNHIRVPHVKRWPMRHSDMSADLCAADIAMDLLTFEDTANLGLAFDSWHDIHPKWSSCAKVLNTRHLHNSPHENWGMPMMHSSNGMVQRAWSIRVHSGSSKP